MTADQAKALRAVAKAIVESVKEARFGAPGGHLYAALMSVMSLDQFEQIMAGLVRTGKVRKDGQVYHFVADL